MKLIRMIYNSVEIDPSVFLIHFFRLFGVYVYEQLLDIDAEHIRNTIKELVEGPFAEGFDASIDSYENEIDMDIVLVSCEEDMNKIWGYDLSDKTVVITTTQDMDWYLWDDWHHVSYNGNDYGTLIQDILLVMRRMNVEAEFCQALDLGKDVFIDRNLTALSLSTTYFYTASNEKEFAKHINAYRCGVRELSEILRDNHCDWENTKFLPIKHAVIKLAYEANVYAVRSKYVEKYDNDELLELCDSMIQMLEVGDDYLESIGLLEAQIFDELLLDKNIAYDLYDALCDDYNAFAYFKKGQYWQAHADDPEMALGFYLESVLRYPTYYRVWYRLGQCYMQIKREMLAYKAFAMVIAILSPKYDARNIRAMEIEHLLKTVNISAKIWFKYLGKPKVAIGMNQWAISIWESIDETEFYDMICNSEDVLYLRRKIKQNLGLKSVYHDLMKLYDCLGDDEMKKKYEEKYISV